MVACKPCMFHDDFPYAFFHPPPPTTFHSFFFMFISISMCKLSRCCIYFFQPKNLELAHFLHSSSVDWNTLNTVAWLAFKKIAFDGFLS